MRWQLNIIVKNAITRKFQFMQYIDTCLKDSNETLVNFHMQAGKF